MEAAWFLVNKIVLLSCGKVRVREVVPQLWIIAVKVNESRQIAALCPVLTQRALNKHSPLENLKAFGFPR
jgi:hypothetical protein